MSQIEEIERIRCGSESGSGARGGVGQDGRGGLDGSGEMKMRS